MKLVPRVVASMLVALSVGLALQLAAPRHAAHAHGFRSREPARVDSAAGEVSTTAVRGGTDARGLPFYTTRAFSARERALLRDAFGVDNPDLLYLSDSTPAAILKVDARPKSCRTCYVDSYRVGFLSLRQPGEGWSAFAGRVCARPRADVSARAGSLDDLDPEARVAFAALFAAAERAGFHVHAGETHRTPAREALLFSRGQGRTHTATSMHSYGRAVDVDLRDGRGKPARRAEWVRFRRFVLSQPTGFRLLGLVDDTWDWAHVELPAPWLGFHSVDAALAFAERCTSDSARAHAPGAAQLGGGTPDPCVCVPHLSARH